MSNICRPEINLLHSKGRLLALPANIRLWWKGMTVANTLAYSKIKIINLVEPFTGPISKGRLLTLLENIRLG
jgi:hypothetical protein